MSKNGTKAFQAGSNQAKTSQPDKLHQSITRMSCQHLLIRYVIVWPYICIESVSTRIFIMIYACSVIEFHFYSHLSFDG